MSPSELQEHQRQRDSLYPLSRQELAVPEIPWTRLRAPAPHRPATSQPLPAAPASPNPTRAARLPSEDREPNPPTPGRAPTQSTTQSPTQSKTQTAQHDAPTTTSPVAPSPVVQTHVNAPEGPVIGRREIMEQLRRPRPKTPPTPSDISKPTPEVDSPNKKSVAAKSIPEPAAQRKSQDRHDSERDPKVASPKFLKHAVRFGGPSPLSATHRNLYEAEVSQFQKNVPHTLQTDEVAELKGVDKRGRVYSRSVTPSEAKPAAATAASSEAVALEQFISEHHRSVEKLPIIQVSSQPHMVQYQTQTEPKPAAAAILELNDDPTPYWIRALIQIVVGTAIAIAVMNLGQWIRSQNTQQLIENAPATGGDFPVQQAQSLQTDRGVLR